MKVPYRFQPGRGFLLAVATLLLSTVFFRLGVADTATRPRVANAG